MYALLSLIISTISSAGSGAQNTAIAKIRAEGATSRAFIQEGGDFSIAGWNEISEGFNPRDVLSASIGQVNLAKADTARRQAEVERKYHRALLLIGISAAALLIIYLVVKK
jgi:hypothetical protein